MKKDQIAIQLYTIREATATDFDAALATIAEIGYTAVEFAGFHDHPAAQIRNMLQANGLRAAAAHIPMSAFKDRFEETVEDLVTIGAGWGIVPWVSPEDRSETVLRGYAEDFNNFAVKLKMAGIKFGYHNHDFEFSEKAESGKSLFDTLVENTEPDSVYFELDAFWAAVGGSDPTAVIKQHGSRIGLLHLKDGKTGEVERGLDIPFGEGNLDWDSMLAAARDAHVAWYVTEQDNPSPEDPYGDVATSLNNAMRLAI